MGVISRLISPARDFMMSLRDPMVEYPAVGRIIETEGRGNPQFA